MRTLVRRGPRRRARPRRRPRRRDEPCQSPYLQKLVGQEDFVYVWTLGIEGLGDGSDKLVTIGANPARADYGKVVSSVSVGGRHEAHHAGFTDDRRQLWAGGLDSSRIFVFDLASDPAQPKLAADDRRLRREERRRGRARTPSIRSPDAC